MTKITISVSKVYKNSGSLRFHRAKTRKYWKHYFIEDDKLQTEWVNGIQAQLLKLKKYHLRMYLCENGHWFKLYLRKPKPVEECPYCED